MLEYQAQALSIDFDAVNRMRGSNGEPDRASRKAKARVGSDNNGLDSSAVIAAMSQARTDTKQGSTIGQIAKLIDRRSALVRPVLRELITQGRISKRGARRSTRYFLR